MKKQVFITGWIPGFRKIQFNSMLRTYSGLSLVDAKRAVDKILEGQLLVVEIEIEDMEMFLTEAKSVGAICGESEHG